MMTRARRSGAICEAVDRILKKEREEFPLPFLWALRGSNLRPYACEAYALNQLS